MTLQVFPHLWWNMLNCVTFVNYICTLRYKSEALNVLNLLMTYHKKQIVEFLSYHECDAPSHQAPDLDCLVKLQAQNIRQRHVIYLTGDFVFIFICIRSLLWESLITNQLLADYFVFLYCYIEGFLKLYALSTPCNDILQTFMLRSYDRIGLLWLVFVWYLVCSCTPFSLTERRFEMFPHYSNSGIVIANIDDILYSMASLIGEAGDKPVYSDLHSCSTSPICK